MYMYNYYINNKKRCGLTCFLIFNCKHNKVIINYFILHTWYNGKFHVKFFKFFILKVIQNALDLKLLWFFLYHVLNHALKLNRYQILEFFFIVCIYSHTFQMNSLSKELPIWKNIENILTQFFFDLCLKYVYYNWASYLNWKLLPFI